MNPIPATVPPAISEGQPTSGRGPRSAGRVAIHEAATIPTGLPTTYPTRMPSVIGEPNASPSSPPVTWIPALASAKTGTTT